MTIECKICASDTRCIEHAKEGTRYYVCPNCEFISKDSSFYVDQAQELSIYSNHNNSIEDPKYVQYFRRFIEKTIVGFETVGKKGLDFGSGPEPVLATLLTRDYGYCMDIYDKFYAAEKVYEGKKYDLVTSTEVVEHLENPLKYFLLFKELLKENGHLAIMTQFHPQNDMKFLGWHYRRDQSHISFYTPKTMHEIAERIGLEILYIDDYKYSAFKRK